MTTATLDIEKISEVRSMFERARNARRRRMDMWQKNLRLVYNRGWQEQRQSWMPTPQASEVYPILSSLVGWMTDQRVSFDLTPAADPHSDFAEFISGICHDLEALIHALWIQKNYDGAVEQVLWDALITSLGVFKVVYDPGSDDGQGNPKVCRIDPFAFYPDPDATDFDTANYLIEARKMSWQELERRFPWALAMIEDDSVGSGSTSDTQLDRRDDPWGSDKQPMTNSAGYPNSVTSSYGRPGQGRDKKSGDGIIVYEAWIRENEFWMDEEAEQEFASDRWKVVVTDGKRIFLEEYAEDLWGHGRHPYVRYVFEDLGDLYGIALVDHLAPCQYSINRLLAALQSHAELVGNPVWVQDSRSNIARTQIVNRAGQRLTKTTGSEVGWINPPQMSRDVPELVKFWIGEMERISGLSAMTRGMTPTGRNAQGVLDSVQESAFVRVRKSLKNLERSLREVGSMLGNLIVENYDMPRVVSIIGPQTENQMKYLKAKHFWVPTMEGSEPLKFAVTVSAGASSPTSRSARAQEADTLAALGHLDTQAVLEAHDYPNRTEIVKRVEQQRAQGLLQQGSQVSRKATRPK